MEALINRMAVQTVGSNRFCCPAPRVRAGKAAPELHWKASTRRTTAPSRMAPHCLCVVHQCVSYVAVNISSPCGWRDLQAEDVLGALLAALKAGQTALADRYSNT